MGLNITVLMATLPSVVGTIHIRGSGAVLAWVVGAGAEAEDPRGGLKPAMAAAPDQHLPHVAA